MNDKNISDLRAALFDTLQRVKDNTIDLDRARAANELCKTLIDSARVEVEHLRLQGEGESTFIQSNATPEELRTAIAGRTVHRLR